MQVCLPCEAQDAPDAVKAVWKLVDEYTLMEAERAMLKLMRGLDKHLQRFKQTTAAAEADAVRSVSTAVAGNTAAAEAGFEAEAESTRLSQISSDQAAPNEGLTSGTDRQQQLQHQTVVPDASEHHSGRPTRLSDEPLQPQQLAACQQNGMSASDSQLDRVTIDQQPGLLNVYQQPHRFTADQPSSHQRLFRNEAHRLISSDKEQTGSEMLPLEGPISSRASADGRKEKLEYRLSQDDVYSPTAAEVQALLQSSALNSSHHSQAYSQQQQQQLLPYMAANGLPRPANLGCSPSHRELMNGTLVGADKPAGNVFNNSLASFGMQAAQQNGSHQAEDTSMLPLIYKIQAAQVTSPSTLLAS